MNKSVLVGMISVAGLASSLFAQGGATGPGRPSNTAAGHTIELRIVVDGAPGSPSAGSGIQQFLPTTSTPGYQPFWVSAVGLTVQARVLRPATVPDAEGGTNPPVAVQNFGISAFSNISVSGTNPQYATISMSDPLGNGDFQRGRINAGGTLWGAYNPFRGLFTTAENNTSTGGNRATGNANGASLATNTNVRNGFIDNDSNGNERIRGMDLGYGANSTNRTAPLPTLSNDPNSTSNWQNLYRMIYIPTAVVGGAPRDITVSVIGALRFFFQELFSDPDGEAGTGDERWTYLGLSETAIREASVTFTVPTPGAAAILGLGGLAMARRRRA